MNEYIDEIFGDFDISDFETMIEDLESIGFEATQDENYLIQAYEFLMDHPVEVNERYHQKIWNLKLAMAILANMINSPARD